ncbi:hypothetical protein FRB95_001224 [Tulasnella sp. JGI-2019a]|nr:hypothetical protein FRB95_001224 [Tulasnella sp. JGI-2019a]
MKITGLLDYKDMISVLQTCHAMRTIVETCLYEHIFIPHYDDLRTARLLRTLRTRPDLAHNIITFDGNLYLAPRKSRFPRVIPRTSLGRTWFGQRSMKQHDSRTAIHHTVNVKSLKIHDFGWLGTESQTFVCNAICSTISLTSLNIQGYVFFHPYRHPDSEFQLSVILRHQPLLERLELRDEWNLEQWILPTDVPHLTHLTTRSEEAKIFVPGQPITSLSLREIWVMPNKDLLPFLQFLSTHLHDVQDLTLDGPYYENVPMLTLGFPSFLSLRNFRITVREHCTPDDDDEPREIRCTDLISRVRLECPQLKYLAYSHFSRCAGGRFFYHHICS